MDGLAENCIDLARKLTCSRMSSIHLLDMHPFDHTCHWILSLNLVTKCHYLRLISCSFTRFDRYLIMLPTQNFHNKKSFLNWRRTRVDDQRSFLPLIQHLKTAWESNQTSEQNKLHNQTELNTLKKSNLCLCIWGENEKSHAMRCDVMRPNGTAAIYI